MFRLKRSECLLGWVLVVVVEVAEPVLAGANCIDWNCTVVGAELSVVVPWPTVFGAVRRWPGDCTI